MRRGSRAARRQPRSAAGVGAPATHPGRGWKAGDRSERGGVRGASGRWGLRGWGAGAKGEGRQKKKKKKRKEKKRKAYSTRYSQAVSHPSTNQARPCLASEIRRDRARSGWYGRRRGRLPPGALRALRCACLSLRPAARPSRPQLSTERALHLSCTTRDRSPGGRAAGRRRSAPRTPPPPASTRLARPGGPRGFRDPGPWTRSSRPGMPAADRAWGGVGWGGVGWGEGRGGVRRGGGLGALPPWDPPGPAPLGGRRPPPPPLPPPRPASPHPPHPIPPPPPHQGLRCSGPRGPGALWLRGPLGPAVL